MEVLHGRVCQIDSILEGLFLALEHIQLVAKFAVKPCHEEDTQQNVDGYEDGLQRSHRINGNECKADR